MASFIFFCFSVTLLALGIKSIVIASVDAVQSRNFRRANDGLKQGRKFFAHWQGKGRWIGRAWWSNPTWDWERIDNGKVSAVAAVNRSLSLLPFEVTNQGSSFSIQVTISFKKIRKDLPYIPKSVAAGFGLGRRGPVRDFRSAAVYPQSQLSATIISNGKLSIAGKTSLKSISIFGAPITLTLKGQRVKNFVKLFLTAQQYTSKVTVATTVPLNQVTGSFALITDGPERYAQNPIHVNVHFEQFSMEGTMLQRFSNRMLGAVAWTQYTISQNTLRLQAQLAPIDAPLSVLLVIRSSKAGKQIQRMSTMSDKLSRTATFTVKNWNTEKSAWYDVQVQTMGRLHTWSGWIRPEPTGKKPFKIAAFSCDVGYMFPQNEIVSKVKSRNPDMLFFAGDQMYGFTAGFTMEHFAPLEISMIDFLRRWYLFGWTWRYLLRTRPSVILPDDHDVFHGNLWGAGGRAMKEPKKFVWDSGGYLMPGPWVRAVERCHVGHLPPSYANFMTPLGLKPYFTSLTYGGLSFAVLEDRKFKSAPLSFPLSQREHGKGGHLLGAAQEKFLKNWGKDWNGVSMKVAFSQTVFCHAATHIGPTLHRGRYFHDSGAWPIDARNRAVRLLSNANAVSLHGDQHLGMLLRHGVNKHDDAGFAFMVPGTANGFPRAWWPGVKNVLNPDVLNYTGRFVDSAGHPITVLAVGNPDPGSNLVNPETISRLQLGRIRGSGYGMVELNRKSKTATFHLYRVGVNEKQFAGFPKKVFIGGNPKKLFQK